MKSILWFLTLTVVACGGSIEGGGVATQPASETTTEENTSDQADVTEQSSSESSVGEEENVSNQIANRDEDGPTSMWPKLTSSECVDPPLNQILVGTSLMLCDGTIAEGTLIPPPSCSSDGQVDCISNESFKAASIVGLAEKIVSGNVVAGIGGTVTLPSAAQVLTGSAAFGINGSSIIPSYTPDFPEATNVRNHDTVNGISGTLDECTTEGSSDCVATSTYKAISNSANISAANIRRGINIGGVIGTYPSSSAPLIRYSDAGSSTNTIGSDITDLTDFVSQTTSDGTFEYWDSTGQRRTGSGDSDIVQTNVKDSVNFENLSISGNYTGSCPSIDEWDLRAGVTAGAVTGKLKVSCRNGAHLGTFDGPAIGSLDGTAGGGGSNGSVDFWDSIDDYSFVASSFPASWTTSENYCSNAADWEDVSTQSDGTTPTACFQASDHCMYRDRITNLVWSELQTSADIWASSNNHCDSLNFGGETDWRLPTQKELMTAYTHGFRVLENANYFPSWATAFWSSTTSANTTSNAWIVNVESGSSIEQDKGNAGESICVRDY